MLREGLLLLLLIRLYVDDKWDKRGNMFHSPYPEVIPLDNVYRKRVGKVKPWGWYRAQGTRDR